MLLPRITYRVLIKHRDFFLKGTPVLYKHFFFIVDPISRHISHVFRIKDCQNRIAEIDNHGIVEIDNQYYRIWKCIHKNYAQTYCRRSEIDNRYCRDQ